MTRVYTVVRLEEGSRTEYEFATLTKALNFIRKSKRYTDFELFKPENKNSLSKYRSAK